ncbi:lytic murein transglycosylase [Maricaulis maris]|uniref:Membrane-bound lytic murein transglycosylase B n=1 Tax=Maricaulis maris TaxID=74318 RepID=A0A495DNU5_9PROT|nr:lytic murein transglycosylase [Maricaulis maris]RKR03699.1 membrane-bound lytic murein transglycosylase B [Maricaulis maris]
MIRRLLVLAASFSLITAGVTAQPEGESFADWLGGFRTRLVASGVEEATAAAMLDGLQPQMRIIESDRSQPEFVRPLWSYLDIAASDLRISNGRAAFAENRDAVDDIAAHFGVRAEILIAIWGLESSYGAIPGNNDIVQALATLAWEGRRRSWAEAQLVAVAEMLESGYATRAQLTGSWAGAMGQMQFIPTTYLERAHDWDGDGQRNIWTDPEDALASAANLLAREGWRVGAPTLLEVRVPAEFDFAAWDPGQSRLVSEWAMLGLLPAAGEWQADHLMRAARLELPAGGQGPGFLTFPNFRVIKRYNNSTSYAIGVAHLADRIAGEAPLVGPWPLDNPPINRSQTREVQAGLNALGFDSGTPDGLAGPNTRAALRAFQRAHGLLADGYVGRAMYEAVIAAQAGNTD